VKPGEWEEVEALFASALEEPATERESFVRREASAAGVADEVLSLLHAHDRRGLFDEITARQDASDGGEVIPPGARFGAWEVTGELGRGGMGAVYRARRAEGTFEQEAALKVIQRDLVGQAAWRFRSEQQILARLSHPNIARILDGGVGDDGRPYYVMELVEGVRIDRFCEAGDLSIPDRLRLFVRVCEAVQSAHQSLIVHRDLKPANILVTPEGEPKLLDFGIATLLSEEDDGATPDTRPVVRVLTPDYASPEQLRGWAITTSSDVYQLGLLLYEMLTGRRPYGLSGAAPEGLEAALSNPARLRPSRAMTPGRLSRRLHGDIDAIVLKAIRIEPDRRYGTAGQLAEDVVRHLQGQPVLARPGSRRYRAGKFVRRHTFGVAAATAVFLLTAGFAVGIDRQARRVAVERDRAEEVLDFLLGLFASADPSVARGEETTVREVLDQGARRVRDELSGQPMVQTSLMHAIGSTYWGLGMRDSALALFDEALALRRPVSAVDDYLLIRIINGLGMLHTEVGDFDGARPFLEEALTRLKGADKLGARELARILADNGYAWQVQGELDRSDSLLSEALAVYEALPEPVTSTSAVLTNLGWIEISRGNPEKAADIFRRSVALRRELDPEDPALATSLEALAQATLRTGDYAAADSAVSEALGIRRRTLPPGHDRIAGAMGLRADLLRRRGEPAEAEPLLREVLGMQIARFGENHRVVANLQNALGLTLEDMGRDEEAATLLRQSWQTYTAVFGEDHVNAAIVEANLARVLFRSGATEEARERFAHLVPIVRTAYPDDRRYMDDQVTLGLLDCLADDEQEAIESLQAASNDSRPVEGTRADDVHLRALNTLGSCLQRLGRGDEARSVLRASLDASIDRSEDDAFRVFARERLSQLGEGDS